MNKIIIKEKKEEAEKNIIMMKDMPLGSIGRIIGDKYHRHNAIVRRTLSKKQFCVEDLTINKEGHCWILEPKLKVQLLPDAIMKIYIDGVD